MKYLAEVFGEAAVIRWVLEDGSKGLEDEFSRYMNDPVSEWEEFFKAVKKPDYSKATKLIGALGGLRSIHVPGDEAADKADTEFWVEADKMQRDLEAEQRRTTWPETDKELSARIVMVEGGSSHAMLRLNKGGKHGVREGWEMVFGAGSKFPGVLAPIISVKDGTSEAFVTMPKHELDEEPRHPVTLRKGR